MNKQPLDRGRVVYVAEKYQSNEIDPQTNQPKMKNRYANIGKATLWPSDNGGSPDVQIEIDTMPIGHTGPLKCHVFWDSQNNQQQPQQNQQPAQQQYQQPPHQAGNYQQGSQGF